MVKKAAYVQITRLNLFDLVTPKKTCSFLNVDTSLS